MASAKFIINFRVGWFRVHIFAGRFSSGCSVSFRLLLATYKFSAMKDFESTNLYLSADRL